MSLTPPDNDSAQRPPVHRTSSHSRSGLRLSRHHRERAEHEDATAQVSTDDLPLVERTNALNIADFIARYIDPTQLHIQIAETTPNNDGTATPPSHADIHLYSAASIPSLDFESCFSLIETTSSADYQASSMGWSPTKKRKEMRLPDMRYLVLRGRLSQSPSPALPTAPSRSSSEKKNANSGTTTTNTNPSSEVLGFLSFMTTYEDGKEVLYCYEIHVHPSLQGRGVGRQLMELYETIARRIGVEKTMLTVFRANTAAISFYERLGYGVDEFSPAPKKLRNGSVKEADYLILSKDAQ